MLGLNGVVYLVFVPNTVKLAGVWEQKEITFFSAPCAFQKILKNALTFFPQRVKQYS
jgi:hypothetical protein